MADSSQVAARLDDHTGTYILKWCGCFVHPGGTWPCGPHRGETEEQRKRDSQQMAWEAAAMNGWSK